MIRILTFLLFSCLCFSQQQSQIVLFSNGPSDRPFSGNFQFLFEGNTDEETGNHTASSSGTFTYVPSINAFNGLAIQCNGSQFIDLPASADFSTVNWTVSILFNRAAFSSGFDAILEHDRSGGNWYGLFTKGASGVLNIRTRNTGANPDDVDTPASFTTNTWHHALASYDGTDVTVYVDGALVLDTPSLAGTPALSGIRLLMNLASGEGYVGIIDRIEYWNVAKNAAQASDIRDCAINGNNCVN